MKLEQTRSRAYKKNDQAWVEQKNGAIVRRLVGYGRLSGLAATQTLAKLYTASRLYINYFQPSIKLKSKAREGARVSKTYHAPAIPCDRLLASDSVSDTIKQLLRTQFASLDPVSLLRDMRTAQQAIANAASSGPGTTDNQVVEEPALSSFLDGLASAWKDGEVRPTHRKRPAAERWWKTRADPFEHVWSVVEGWLLAEPTTTGKDLMDRLAKTVPDAYASKAQLRTLQRRIKAWRAKKAKDLILGKIRTAVPAE
jgi:hypothetical protein